MDRTDAPRINRNQCGSCPASLRCPSHDTLPRARARSSQSGSIPCRPVAPSPPTVHERTVSRGPVCTSRSPHVHACRGRPCDGNGAFSGRLEARGAMATKREPVTVDARPSPLSRSGHEPWRGEATPEQGRGPTVESVDESCSHAGQITEAQADGPWPCGHC